MAKLWPFLFSQRKIRTIGSFALAEAKLLSLPFRQEKTTSLERFSLGRESLDSAELPTELSSQPE